MKHLSEQDTYRSLSVLSHDRLVPVPLVRDVATEREHMTEDRLAVVELAEREEALKAGACALTRRLKPLEARAANLRAGLDEAGPLGWQVINEVEELQEDIFKCRWGLYELTADAIGGEYNAADIALWCERAVKMGATHPRIDQTLLLDLVHVRKVPNEPFRARYADLIDQAPDSPNARASGNGKRVAIAAPLLTKIHRTLSRMEQARGENYGSASLIHDGVPQTRMLERWLGMQTIPSTRGFPPSLRLFVSYEQAEALAIALGMEPHAAGI